MTVLSGVLDAGKGRRGSWRHELVCLFIANWRNYMSFKTEKLSSNGKKSEKTGLSVYIVFRISRKVLPQ